MTRKQAKVKKAEIKRNQKINRKVNRISIKEIRKRLKEAGLFFEKGYGWVSEGEFIAVNARQAMKTLLR